MIARDIAAHLAKSTQTEQKGRIRGQKHQMKRIGIGIGLVVLAIAAFVIWPQKLPLGTLPDAPPEAAQSGDIVFMQGRSFGARLQNLTRPIYGAYSHVGILDRRADGDYIIHATPAKKRGLNKDGIVLESWDFMVTEERLLKVHVMQVAAADKTVKARAIERAHAYMQAGVPFDPDYDNTEHEKIYCSELVLLAYQPLSVKPDNFDSDDLIYVGALAASPYLEDLASP